MLIPSLLGLSSYSVLKTTKSGSARRASLTQIYWTLDAYPNGAESPKPVPTILKEKDKLSDTKAESQEKR